VSSAAPPLQLAAADGTAAAAGRGGRRRALRQDPEPSDAGLKPSVSGGRKELPVRLHASQGSRSSSEFQTLESPATIRFVRGK
jgi:hypothetical protein